LAVKRARKWIHGLSDLVVVLLATPFISSMFIPSRPEAYCFGKKRIVQSHCVAAAASNIHSWLVVVHAL
jgi:hypothetical protein